MVKDRESNKKIIRICVFGTFDIIHVGHVLLLENTKTAVKKNLFQDRDEFHLTVVVARDSNVKKMKGKLPVFPENDRLKIISAIRYVDHSLLGNEAGSKFDILEKIRPDVVVLGYDQWVPEEVLLQEGVKKNLSFKVLRLPKYGMQLASSSSVKKVINSNNGDS
ncbi:MAG: adenylyltransferase/cytidyltransferase family protein [Candidatus Odinarchaeota archaeon]